MAQLSVPTSLLSSADLATEPSGVTLDSEVVTDVSSNPIESDVGSNTEISRTGASSLVDAVDDTSEAKFWQVYNDLLGTGSDRGSIASVVAYAGQTLSDPSVDTDHNILLLIKRNGDPPNGTEAIFFGLYSSSDLQNAVVFLDITSLVPQTTFALIEIALSAPEVQDFRSKGGYLAGPAFYLSISGATADPENEPFTQTYDVAYIALEVPEGGTPPDIELTGNVTVDIDASQDVPGNVTVEIDASSTYQPSDVISNVDVEINSSSQYGQNEIDGNVTVDIDSSAVLVISTDPSGLYTLVPGQKFDRLYNRITEDNVDTIDVAIPRPFIKTAFIGG